MELGEYFGKVFGNMFHKDIYWPTFIAAIIIGVIFAVLALLFISPFLTDIAKLYGIGTTGLLTEDVTLIEGTSPSANLFALGTTFVVLLSILLLIGMYLYSVLAAFIVGKIGASESGTQTEFFVGFGSSFLAGLKLFGAMIIYYIIIAIIFAIIWAISLIPFVGFVIAIILGILLMLYLLVVCPTLIGNICTGKAFGESISGAFSLPFKKLSMVGYALVLTIVYGVLAFILVLLNMIPFLGWIIILFATPLLMLYFLTMAYHFSKEEVSA